MSASKQIFLHVACLVVELRHRKFGQIKPRLDGIVRALRTN